MNSREFNPHVTVATVVSQQNQFLIVEEQINGETRFNQPAGHLEANESLIAAAKRETLEETGWEVDITGFLGVCIFKASNGVTYVRNTFCATPIHKREPFTLDTGIIAAHWMTLNEIQQKQEMLRSPMIIKSIENYLKGNIFPATLVTYLSAV
ncbi:NUDIX hydrolase [Sessilibacter sp. MAH4]